MTAIYALITEALHTDGSDVLKLVLDALSNESGDIRRAATKIIPLLDEIGL